MGELEAPVCVDHEFGLGSLRGRYQVRVCERVSRVGEGVRGFGKGFRMSEQVSGARDEIGFNVDAGTGVVLEVKGLAHRDEW